jgi:hypothetical protein
MAKMCNLIKTKNKIEFTTLEWKIKSKPTTSWPRGKKLPKGTTFVFSLGSAQCFFIFKVAKLAYDENQKINTCSK